MDRDGLALGGWADRADRAACVRAIKQGWPVTVWPVCAEALTVGLKMDSEAVGTADPSSAIHRRKTLSRTRHSPSASSKMGTVMPATRGCQTAVARHFVKGAGPSNGRMEGQALPS